MKYPLLIFLFLFTTLFGADVNKYNNITSFLISKDKAEYKTPTYNEYKAMKLKNFSIKMGVDKNTLLNKTYYLSIVSDIKSLKYTNAKYKIQDHLMVITLDQNVPEELIFEYSYEKVKRPEFRFNVLSSFEYKKVLPFEGILYGLAYGIIFSAFLYYLVIFFSTRRLCFLYYSLMQFFVLLSLMGFAYFSFKSYPDVLPQAVIDIFESSAFLFTFLFAKEILDSKRIMPLVNHVLSFCAAINFLDILAILIFKYSILYEYVTFFWCFLIPTLAGIIAVYKGNKNAIFYTFGWTVLFAFVFSYENDFIPLSGIYTIHIAAPLESLIFSFALAYMLKNLVTKQNEQEKMLIHKSKLATIGEMINNIAHQWRQPLAHLGYINMNLEISSENNEFEKEFFVKKIKESNEQIKFMSKTIDDFRDFYKVEKEKQEFLISNAAKLAMNIISPSLKKRKIDIQLEVLNDIKVKGYENEYAQVILNLLTNSVDIFNLNKIEKPKIKISIDTKNNKSLTTVCDNAGGIKQEDLQKVFEAYFTTKKRGTGIGLYMSLLIIQTHFNGHIKVFNKEKGACFKIEV